MRKDRIEERLAGLDREIKSLKSEHKQSTESIIMELKHFQEMMLEEKVAEIREELSRGYMDIALNCYMDGASAAFKDVLPDPCPHGKKETCKRVFRERLENAAVKLKDAEGKDIVGTTMLIATDDEAKLGWLKDSAPCGSCYQRYNDERESLVKVIEKLSSYRKSIADRAVDDYIRQLPDDMVISSIIDPLSHKARFRMLKSLALGSMSYKELTEATGFDGGHLIYHLNKLIDAGLVVKGDAGGRYSITEKGIGVMDLVKTLYYK